jgi:DNA modification methylase
MNIIQGDALEILKTLQDESIDCCITSPPYYGLRDYGVDKQIGLEETPQEYIEKLVLVFREIRRILKKEGTLWVNIGDSYNGSSMTEGTKSIQCKETMFSKSKRLPRGSGRYEGGNIPVGKGLKPKDLIGIPWMLAFALRTDGWYLRQDIIWSKPNPMPESVMDRCTKSHEYVFLLSKSRNYYFDNEAVKERSSTNENRPGGLIRDRIYSYNSKQAILRKQRKPAGWYTRQGAHGSFHREGRSFDIEYTLSSYLTRNKRSVWEIATSPFKEAHFATFLEDLVEPMVLAGCHEKGIVLDPFAGAGTTGLVALKNGRDCVLIDLNPEYVKMMQDRLKPVLLRGRVMKGEKFEKIKNSLFEEI